LLKHQLIKGHPVLASVFVVAVRHTLISTVLGQCDFATGIIQAIFYQGTCLTLTEEFIMAANVSANMLARSFINWLGCLLGPTVLQISTS
jgi:hypothetical protein